MMIANNRLTGTVPSELFDKTHFLERVEIEVGK